MYRVGDTPRCPDCSGDLRDADEAAHDHQLKAMLLPPGDLEGSHRYHEQVARAIREHEFYCEACDSGVDADDATPPGSQTTFGELVAIGDSR